jgi:hypothetical protein
MKWLITLPYNAAIEWQVTVWRNLLFIPFFNYALLITCFISYGAMTVQTSWKKRSYFWLVFHRWWVRISAGTLASLIDFFYSFFQSFQEKDRIVDLHHIDYDFRFISLIHYLLSIDYYLLTRQYMALQQNKYVNRQIFNDYELLIGRNLERKVRGLLRYYPNIFLDKLRKTTRTIFRDIWSANWDSKPASLKYEVKVVFLVRFI